MDKKLTLGSLFDGSGGFPLGGLLCGIEPLWASEVEPFPIRVTTKRLPKMKHLGDLTKINGATVPPVDIITGGFCCQDLSVAGKRAGLHGERSGLFFEMIRIMKEMLTATNNEYPKYAVLENVPGMYSSNGGLDFQEVLNELIKTKDKTLSVPLPEKCKWSTAGEIVGDGFSIGWRTFDAQFWGVAQRRRRCYIVVDFTGERAGEILFDESRLRGNPPQGCFTGQAAAGNPADSVGNAVAFEPGACSRIGGHVWQGEPTGALRAAMGDNQLAVVYDARGNGNGEIVNTITGDHNNRVTDYTALVMNERQCALTVGVEVANTLTGTDFKGTQCVFEPKAYGICSQASNSMLSDNPHSGIYEAETAKTLDASVPDPNKNAGGMAIVAVEGNGSRPSHRGGGYGSEVSYTLNSVERHSVCYQDKVGALCASDYKFPQNMQVDQGKAIVEQVTVENYQHSNYREVEVGGTLKANGGDFPGGENMVVENRYVVRRLTPTECALLQGFPPDWCAGLETPDPTEGDIAFWTEVWETHRLIVGTSSRPKSRNQIVKWLQNPHSDSAEYKMWGNGVALPCVVFVLGGIVYYSKL